MEAPSRQEPPQRGTRMRPRPTLSTRPHLTARAHHTRRSPPHNCSSAQRRSACAVLLSRPRPCPPRRAHWRPGRASRQARGGAGAAEAAPHRPRDGPRSARGRCGASLGPSCAARAARLGNVWPGIYSARCRAGDSGSTLSLEFNPQGLKAGSWQNEGKPKSGGKEIQMAGVGSPSIIRVFPVRAPARVRLSWPCCPGGLRPWVSPASQPAPPVWDCKAAGFAALPESLWNTAIRATSMSLAPGRCEEASPVGHSSVAVTLLPETL